MALPHTAELVELPDGRQYQADNLAPLEADDDAFLLELAAREYLRWLVDVSAELTAELSETDPPHGAQESTPTPPVLRVGVRMGPER
jgi:hypothetical protein